MAVGTIPAAGVAGIAASPPTGTTTAQWVAKARQESSFDRTADNGIAVGLWQVHAKVHLDLIHRLGAQHWGAKTYGPKTLANAKLALKSPNFNWLVTREIYRTEGWGAWKASGGKPSPTAEDRAAAAAPDMSYSTSGHATEERPGAGPGPEPGVKPINVLGSVGGFLLEVPDQLARIAGILADAGRWISDRDNWSRVALVAVGGVVTIGAIVTVARPIVEPVAQAAASATPVGRAAGRRP